MVKYGTFDIDKSQGESACNPEEEEDRPRDGPGNCTSEYYLLWK